MASVALAALLVNSNPGPTLAGYATPFDRSDSSLHNPLAAPTGIVAAVPEARAIATSADLQFAQAGGAAATPAPRPSAPGAQQTIRGLVFLSDPVRLQRDGWPAFAGIDARDVAILDDPAFAAIVGKYLGQPLALASLDELVRDTIVYARQKQYPVVDVAIPEQEVIQGTVQVLVTIARLGTVGVEGNRWFSSRQLAGAIRLKPGDPIRADRLNADLAWLNNNPFRSVDGIFRQGAEAGTTDIILRTNDRFPLRVFGGYSNDGTRATDTNRLTSGVSWGDAFWLGHRLDYQYTRSLDTGKFEGHTLAYTVPLPWRDILSLTAGYSRSRSNVSGVFGSEGEGQQYSARYIVPLSRFDVFGGLTHEISLGGEYKRNNSDLEFGGTSVFHSAPEVNQGVLSYNAGLLDAIGSTTLSLDGYYSPGNVSGSNTDARFQQARAHSDSNYAYARGRLERVFFLPDDFSLVGRGTAQFANRNLLFSERLQIGGVRTVRGYAEDALSGDDGYLASVELRTPSFGVLPRLGLKKVEDQLQFLMFFDYGKAITYQPAPSEEKNRTAASVGGGLRYSVAPYVTMRLDYGAGLHSVNPAEPRDRPSRLHFGLIVGY